MGAVLIRFRRGAARWNAESLLYLLLPGFDFNLNPAA
jgi:hypothetical protein